MKIQITYRLFYDNHNSAPKIVNIDNCDDKEHAEARLRIWVKEKFKAAKSMKVLQSDEIIKDKQYLDLEYLKNMFNLKE